MSVSSVRLDQPPQDGKQSDDLARNVFGIFGIPIDAVDLDGALRQIEEAIDFKQKLLISTPNINFLVTSWEDSSFRESLLLSDLCPADGMPLVWIARLLDIPIRGRVSGSDIFNALKKMRGKKLSWPKAFLFGGADGLVRNLADKLNLKSDGMKCVGAISPGFGTVAEMSNEQTIAAINASGAEFLAVFLSAKKAQAWLLENYHRIDVPVRGQFGATINFEVGTIKRAPAFVRSLGFEWLWRIKEEPYLWARYARDSVALLGLLSSCVVPLYIATHIRSRRRSLALQVNCAAAADAKRVIVRLHGDATAHHIDAGIVSFHNVLDSHTDVEVDLSETRYIDQRFFGLLLMVRKQLAAHGLVLTFSSVSHRMRHQFKLNRFEYLL